MWTINCTTWAHLIVALLLRWTHEVGLSWKWPNHWGFLGLNRYTLCWTAQQFVSSTAVNDIWLSLSLSLPLRQSWLYSQCCLDRPFLVHCLRLGHMAAFIVRERAREGVCICTWVNVYIVYVCDFTVWLCSSGSVCLFCGQLELRGGKRAGVQVACASVFSEWSLISV